MHMFFSRVFCMNLSVLFQNMGIICGRKVTIRTKRGVEEVTPVNIGFDLNSISLGDNPQKDCPNICRNLGILPQNCNRDCKSAYKRYHLH